MLYLPICERREEKQKERLLKNMEIPNINGRQSDVQGLTCRIMSRLCLYTSVPVSTFF